MTFPEEPLNLKVRIMPDDTWIDITSFVYKDEVSITRGSADETSESQPSKCRLTLNNIDGRFSPRNPNGPYFGLLGRNTPLMVSYEGATPFLDVTKVGSAQSAITTIPGDFDVRVDAQLLNWGLEVGSTEIAACYDSGIASGWFLKIDNGRPALSWFGGPGSTVATSSAAIVPPPSGRVTLRAVTNNTDLTVTFYQGPTVDGPWTLIKVVDYGDADIVPDVSTAGTYVGGQFAGVSYQNPVGRFFAFKALDGENGPALLDVDFTQQTPGDTSFTDNAGVDWSLALLATISNEYPRFVGEVSSWPSRWTTGGFDAWEEIEGGSVLRRLGQGANLDSAMTRSIPRESNIAAHWPMEDGTLSSTFGATTPNTRAMTFDGEVTPAGHAGPLGSKDLPSWSTDSSWHGEIVGTPFTGSTSWRVNFLVDFQQLTATEQMFFRIQSSGTVNDWRFFMDSDTFRITGNQGNPDTGGTEIVNYGVNWPYGSLLSSPGAQINRWQKWELKLSESGGTVTWTVTGAVVGASGSTHTDTYSGSAGWPNSVMGPPRGLSSQLSGMSLGQVAVYNDDVGSIYENADNGYNGETAAARLERLGAEEGIDSNFLGDYQTSFTMGAQRADRLLDLARETATADRGIFGDTRDNPNGSGFRMVSRTALYNQPPALILDYEADGEVHSPLDPTGDDLDLVNRVTVKRDQGSQATAELSEGRNSVLAPPLGVWPYETSLTVNTDSDSGLLDRAGWEVHLGTWDEERYPTVVLRLQAAPHLIPDALFIDQGTRIRIRNARDVERPWISPGDIDLLVLGYTESMSQFVWELKLQCVPARPWDVPVPTEDATDASPIGHDHIDTDGTLTTQAINETTTFMPVYAYDGPTWTDELVDMPFDLTVGGEQVRVIAPGGYTNPNAFFETDLTGWTLNNVSAAAMTRDTDVVHPDPSAVASMKVAPVGGVSAITARITTDAFIIPGTTYRFSGWFFSPLGYSGLSVNAQWLNVGGSIVSSAFTNHVVPAGIWTYLEDEFVAPASSVSVMVCPRISNTPTSSDVFYVWAPRVSRLTSDWANDTFNRTEASGWGESDSGDNWTTAGGTASNFSVGSGYGSHLVSSVGVSRRATITVPGEDADIYCDMATSAVATGASIWGGIMTRYTDADNLYYGQLSFGVSGALQLELRKRVATVETSLGTYNYGVAYTASTFYRVRVKTVGSMLYAKAWPATIPEPPVWHVTASDATFTSGNIGLRTIASVSNTNVSPSIRYDNFRVASPQVLAVERSRNDVAKAHDAGTDARLTYPAITAL